MKPRVLAVVSWTLRVLLAAVFAFVLLGALVAVLAIGIRGDSQAAGALRASDRH